MEVSKGESGQECTRIEVFSMAVIDPCTEVSEQRAE